MKKFILLTLGFLLFATANAENYYQLLSDYQKPKSGTRLQSANRLFALLYKEGFADTLRRFRRLDRATNAYLLEAMSEYTCNSGDFAKSIELCKEAAADCEALHDKVYAANCYSTLCVCFQRVGDLQEAIRYGKKCYDMDKQSGDPANMASSLSNLATLYTIDQQPAVARGYVEQSIALERKINDRPMLALRLGLACEIYTALHQYDHAIRLGKEAYAIDSKDGRGDKAGKRLAQLAAAQSAKGSDAEAEENFRKAIALLQKYNDQVSLGISDIQLGELLARQHRNQEAESYLTKGLSIADAIGNKTQQLKACKMLADLLAESNPKEALRYMKRVNGLEKDLFKTESENQINKFNIENETHKKEERIAEQNLQLEKEKDQRLLLIGTLILIAFGCIALLIINRLKTERNRELKYSNDLKDKFQSLIAHDLKNPVVSQTQMLQLLRQQSEQLSAEQRGEIVNALCTSSESLQALLLDLLTWSRLETGKTVYNPCTFSLQSVVEETRQQIDLQLQEKHLTLNIETGDNLLVESDRNMVATILRNLLTNAIKFSYDGGKIELRAQETSDRGLTLSIGDEGVGMDETMRKRLLTTQIGQSTQGTSGETGLGLGLIVCREMIKLCGSRLAVESNKGKGSTFSFQLKLSTNGQKD